MISSQNFNYYIFLNFKLSIDIDNNFTLPKTKMVHNSQLLIIFFMFHYFLSPPSSCALLNVSVLISFVLTDSNVKMQWLRSIVAVPVVAQVAEVEEGELVEELLAEELRVGEVEGGAVLHESQLAAHHAHEAHGLQQVVHGLARRPLHRRPQLAHAPQRRVRVWVRGGGGSQRAAEGLPLLVVGGGPLRLGARRRGRGAAAALQVRVYLALLRPEMGNCKKKVI